MLIPQVHAVLKPQKGTYNCSVVVGIIKCNSKTDYRMICLLENISYNSQISFNTFQMQSGKSQPMIRSSVVAVFVVNTVPLWGLNACVSKE